MATIPAGRNRQKQARALGRRVALHELDPVAEGIVHVHATPADAVTGRKARRTGTRSVAMRRAFLDSNLTMRNGSHYVAGVARSYSVDEAKAKLGEILRRVKQGRSVTISERGRDIARVVPIAQADTLAARLESLRQAGIITPATGDVKAIRPIARRPGALRRFLRSRS